MEYPLIIDGAEKGKLTVTQEGLYTVYEAQLDLSDDRLYRLWLHGVGDCAYLGLMQPWSGGMYLRKKLSRSQQQGFPQTIEFASNEEKTGLHNEIKPAETEPESCPWPAPVEESNEGLLWLRRPDGSLVSHDGLSSLVALPVSLKSPAPGAVLRQIEGREYMIFRY